MKPARPRSPALQLDKEGQRRCQPWTDLCLKDRFHRREWEESEEGREDRRGGDPNEAFETELQHQESEIALERQENVW